MSRSIIKVIQEGYGTDTYIADNISEWNVFPTENGKHIIKLTIITSTPGTFEFDKNEIENDKEYDIIKEEITKKQ